MTRHARHRRRIPDRHRRPWAGCRAPDLAAFLRLVDRAVAELPAEIRAHLDNVEIAVEDVPFTDEILLGLYQGVPVTDRGFGDALLPDRITLFRGPLELRAQTFEELRHEVATTVVHEIAHHYGIDDDRLDELGWG
jgi:predicted Zn-dependent protease with MMP-like domain